ncbi:unnamed protein product (macronuclear) [Paramecium tetraurelia]|uniref:Uncharacterized protein n=1 Tax=Paramecium tetraurelia TaxID=5888 RepID=A0CZ46_PARTE|nr:uncharacterized protein GSPATT00039102001 [Paramecium tetraurelia]CAK76063.1 unnamed protein product [Paramecium tetraurelia]|eukprot:XP_001443460.1 hypothetical protein (macronuclear) [Paramecium tetraurelia strain d4-2]
MTPFQKTRARIQLVKICFLNAYSIYQKEIQTYCDIVLGKKCQSINSKTICNCFQSINRIINQHLFKISISSLKQIIDSLIKLMKQSYEYDFKIKIQQYRLSKACINNFCQLTRFNALLGVAQKYNSQRMTQGNEFLQFTQKTQIKNNRKIQKGGKKFLLVQGLFKENIFTQQKNKLNGLDQELDYYDQAIKKNPQKSGFYNGKGTNIYLQLIATTLQKMNRLEEALNYYDQAIQKNCKVSSYYFNKAITLEKLNRLEEALEYYNEAIMKNPEVLDYYDNKRQMLQKMNRFEEALQCYDQAFKKKPEKSGYYNSKAITLKNMDSNEEALRYFDSAIEKNPEDSDYYFNKAITLDKLNRFGEALENYNKAIMKNPEASNYYDNKGRIE